MARNPTYRLEVLVYPETNKWAPANDVSTTLIASSQKKITSFPSEDLSANTLDDNAGIHKFMFSETSFQ